MMQTFQNTRKFFLRTNYCSLSREVVQHDININKEHIPCESLIKHVTYPVTRTSQR